MNKTETASDYSAFFAQALKNTPRFKYFYNFFN